MKSTLIYRWAARLLVTTALLIGLGGAGCQSDQTSLINFTMPSLDPVTLVARDVISAAKIVECSGIVHSRGNDNLYWVHNDSGDSARIFPIKSDGTIFSDQQIDFSDGIHLEGAENVDWEEIAYFDNKLILADIGNNNNNRDDLVLYEINEPTLQDRHIKINGKYPFEYPDQRKGFFVKKNFDCEATFTFQSKLYLITKHRSDRNCTLYRFDQLYFNRLNVPTKLVRAGLGGMVTAADLSEELNALVVLTYQSIWLFSDFESDRFFEGKVRYLPINARQCEAVCFKTADTILVTNEQRDMFELPISDLIELH